MADHSWNPWVGCSKISPACDHCYAESWAKRTGHPELWTGERRRTTGANWRKPEQWNREAAAAGVRARVFCASLADVFDNQVPQPWRFDLWALIERTPNLDWLLLTKRPQNIVKMLPWYRAAWPHVWLGTTVENQEEADRRIPLLLEAPAAVRFLSCEPLLGGIGLRYLQPGDPPTEIDALSGTHGVLRPHGGTCERIDWVIAGGESGPGARPMHPKWARSLRDQCQAAGTAFFFKQWGEWLPVMEDGDSSGAQWVAPDDGGPEDRLDDIGRRRVHRFDGGGVMARVGKKAAGRLLDGREWNESPRVSA